MTDHELIMATADVAGLTLIPRDDGTYEVANLVYTRRWNPLKHNGDAFQLMVDHELMIFYSDTCTSIFIDWMGGIGFVEEPVPLGSNRCAAMRRTIVLAVIEKAKHGTKTNK